MMYPRDLIGGLDRLRQQAVGAASSTISLAKPVAGAAVAGLGSMARHAASSTVSLTKPVAGAAVAGLGSVTRHAASSTVSLAKPAAGAAVAGLGSVTRHAAGMVSTREGAVIGRPRRWSSGAPSAPTSCGPRPPCRPPPPPR